MRFLLLSLLAAILGGNVRDARATTRLYLMERDARGNGFSGSFGSADGAFTVRFADSGRGVDVGFSPPNVMHFAHLIFVARGGVPPGPGSYDEVRSIDHHLPSEGPLLGVYTYDTSSCDEFTARFVVHELVTGPSGEVLAFSADYVRTCDRDSGQRMGSVRFHAGDPGCESAPDGTACDDRDACTPVDTCQAGRCTGTDVVTPGCAASDACHDAPACDPTSGSCVAPAIADGSECSDENPATNFDRCYRGACTGCVTDPPCRHLFGRDYVTGGCEYDPFTSNGSSCDDPDTCTVDGTCQDGQCRSAGPPCNDHDPCTLDSCAAPADCRHDAIDGCWTMLGRTVVQFSANGDISGHHVTCAYRCRHDAVSGLFFDDADHFRYPGGTATCPSSQTVDFPDEVGTVRKKSHGRLQLTTENLAELQAAARLCQGSAVRLLASRASLRPAEDAAHLQGTSTTRVRYPDRIAVVSSQVTRVRATLRSASTPTVPALSRGTARLPICPSQIRLRCSAS